MASEDFPAPSEGFVLTHCIVAADVARSRGCARPVRTRLSRWWFLGAVASVE